jgi:protein gp37
MGKDSKISWTDHTFNPWWGCTVVSPAEGLAKRTGHACFGADAPRRLFGEKHWTEPLRWAERAHKQGHKSIVFCASMADVFEQRPELDAERAKLWKLIEATRSALSWLLLTKRPQHAAIPADLAPHVALGVTVETVDALWRVPYLGAHPGLRFVSFEPLLQRIPRSHLNRVAGDLDWTIIGGESGPGARAFDVSGGLEILEWAQWRSKAAMLKQIGASPEIDGVPLPRSKDLAGHPDTWPAEVASEVRDRMVGVEQIPRSLRAPIGRAP